MLLWVDWVLSSGLISLSIIFLVAKQIWIFHFFRAFSALMVVVWMCQVEYQIPSLISADPLTDFSFTFKDDWFHHDQICNPTHLIPYWDLFVYYRIWCPFLKAPVRHFQGWGDTFSPCVRFSIFVPSRYSNNFQGGDQATCSPGVSSWRSFTWNIGIGISIIQCKYDYPFNLMSAHLKVSQNAPPDYYRLEKWCHECHSIFNSS